MSDTGNVQIESGSGAGQHYPLTPGGITIGRQADNTITVDDPQVSRHHTRIEQRAGITLASDLNTANGTYLNEQRIVGSAPLQSGDLLRIGNVTLRYTVIGAGPQAPTKRNMRLPVIIGVASICLLLCLCGTATLAVIVGSRDGAPTEVIASATTITAPTGNTIATIPTPTATTANGAKVAPTTTPAVFSTATATPSQTVAAGLLSTATLAPRPTTAPLIVSTATTAPNPTVIPIKPTATTPSIALTTPPVVGTAGGTYRGTVKRGYTITFRVSPDGKRISAVEARVLTNCGTGRSIDTVFAPEVSFSVAADGRFSGEGEYQPGFRYEFSGQLRGTSATGSLRDSSVVVGAVCDTQKLEWAAELQP
jgi:pSer/pThr/pTyr-binding forkhead associated (FHA) protein